MFWLSEMQQRMDHCGTPPNSFSTIDGVDPQDGHGLTIRLAARTSSSLSSHMRCLPQSGRVLKNGAHCILGANTMGIYSIWITRRATASNPAIIPQATVSTLQEIPALLRTIL
jgi:Tfp pilus assembly protein PilN